MSNLDVEQAWHYGQFWIDMMTKMATTAAANAVQGGNPVDTSKQVRGQAFSTMTEQAEQFLRSPQFLETMQQTMQTSLEFQKRWQEFFTHVRHQTQGVATQDVDATMVMVRHMESRVLDGLETIQNQLNDLGRRLERLEASAKAGNGKAPGRAAAANGESQQQQPAQREGGKQE